MLSPSPRVRLRDSSPSAQDHKAESLRAGATPAKAWHTEGHDNRVYPES